MPLSIISDRDKVFTSLFWQELFRLANVQMRMSSAYHPQTDGQTERVNQCLEQFFRCFVNACPSKWTNWIFLVEFWYNTSWHSALKMSPFEVLYGHKPCHFGLNSSAACTVPDVETWLQEKHTMSNLIQQQLARAQQCMKIQADKHHTERAFDVGDRVYLKLQPYVQSSLAPRSSQKLAHRFFGLFTVVQKVGKVAYKLLLPDHAKIHPIFHVSQLKKMIPSTHSPAQLPHGCGRLADSNEDSE